MGRYKLIGQGEMLEFSVDWESELVAGNPDDLINTSSWEINPQSGSPPEPEAAPDGWMQYTTACMVSKARKNEIYRLTNTITTTQGLTLRRSMTLRGYER